MQNPQATLQKFTQNFMPGRQGNKAVSECSCECSLRNSWHHLFSRGFLPEECSRAPSPPKSYFCKILLHSPETKLLGKHLRCNVTSLQIWLKPCSVCQGPYTYITTCFCKVSLIMMYCVVNLKPTRNFQL